MVDADGAYYPHVALFAGLKVLETEGKKAGKFGPANDAVIDKLIEAGTLLARGRVEHSYPHSWRSKAPVIFRNTPQWFIRWTRPSSDGPHPARAGAGRHRGHPTSTAEAGKNRIRSMVETRPDWLISRQRAWGSPLAMFVEKATGHPLRDPDVNARIVAAIEAHGADAWFTRPGRVPGHRATIRPTTRRSRTSSTSGSTPARTHAFTIEGRADSHWPADLYLEGSDQHRGWFQSSLLESCGTRGRAPFKAVLTHGFTLDEQGEKMSKSLGNTIDPQVVISESGAEILRLWAAMVDYAEDQRIGQTILQTTTDAYRKLRNTVRYLLGAAGGLRRRRARGPATRCRRWSATSCTACGSWTATCARPTRAYQFDVVVREVACSARTTCRRLYFDIRKDALYCDAPDSLRRRACAHGDGRGVRAPDRLAVADACPSPWRRPGRSRFPGAGSNCLRVIPETPDAWRNDAEAAAGERIEQVTVAVTGALEVERREKRIGGALDAAPQGLDRRPASRRVRADRSGRSVPHQRRGADRRRGAARRLPLGRSARRRGEGRARPRPQVRPLLARPARGEGRRRPVPALRGRGRRPRCGRRRWTRPPSASLGRRPPASAASA